MITRRVIFWGSLLLTTTLIFLGVVFFRNIPEGWVREVRLAGTNSSPRAIDLNGDGILDIVIGAGGEEYDTTDYAVLAINGDNGEILWSVKGHNQVVGSALFKDITGDGVPDVFIGGRSAQCYAINGATGEIIWQYLKQYHSSDVKGDTLLLNFFNPQFIADQNGDGVEELLIAFGGFVKANPGDPDRPCGQLMVLNTATGEVMRRSFVPDGKETYMSPIIYERSGETVIVFGTGGETLAGKSFAVSLATFLKNGLEAATVIDSSATKGFIAPPIVADITRDGVEDLVVLSMDGQMRAYAGPEFLPLWQTTVHNRAEVQGMPAPLFFNDDDVPDFFAAFNIGTWPQNDTTIHAIVSGADGSVLFKDTLGMLQFSSPVLFDFDQDGRDDVLYHINYKEQTPFFPIYKNQLMVYNGRTGATTPLDSLHDGKNLGTTPLITDLDDDGNIDIVSCYMTQNDEFLVYHHLVVQRIELPMPLRRNLWGGYMGTDSRSRFIP